MRLLYSFIIALASMACSPDTPVPTPDTGQKDTTAVEQPTEKPAEKPEPEKPTIKPVDEEKVDDGIDENAYNHFERVALQSEIENVQPMTGLVLWTDNSRSESMKDCIQLEFAYMLYNQVCKEKDVYDWTPMDNLLEEVASRGHQLVVRFRYT